MVFLPMYQSGYTEMVILRHGQGVWVGVGRIMGRHVRYLEWSAVSLNQSRSALTQLLSFLFEM